MKRLLFISVTVLGAAVATWFVVASAGDAPPLEGWMAQFMLNDPPPPAPETELQTVAGQPVTLAAFKNKVVLVNFWATWCAPCEREMPHLGTLETARGGEGFEVIVISVDQSTDEAYARQRLIELTGGVLSFYHAPPENWDLIYNAGARGFPTTVIYSPDGTEVARLAGEADWSEGIALAFVDEVLGR